jgi:predicted Zn-dependent peptidase
MKQRPALRILLVAAVFVFAQAAAAPASGLKIGESKDKLGMIDLPSGMRIVIEEDHSKPVVAVVAVINAGAADDPPGKEGLAHLVEHLTFRAKPDRKVQRANQLDFAGASSWNGSTTHDLTTYAVVGPKEALRNLLVIEGGRLLGPLAGLDQRAFDLEREVVKNELADRDEHGEPSAAQAALFAALYPEGHRYHRPAAGNASSVPGLTLADAQAFAQQHYVPTNVTLYVAGDLDLATIHELFGKTLPERFAVAPASGPVKPPERLSAEAPPVVDLPAPRAPAIVKAPLAEPTIYLAWSLPRNYAVSGALLRAIRAAVEADRVWVSTASDIKSIRTTLVAGRDGSTLVCAVALKEGRTPEKSLERVLDQFHRFSDPNSETGTRAGEEVAGRLDSSAGSMGLPTGGARTLAPLGGMISPHQPSILQPLTGGDSMLSTANRPAPNVNVAIEDQIPRFIMTAVVADVVEAESVVGRARDRATLVHYTGDSSAWDKDMTAMTEIGPSKWQSFTLEWLSRSRARAVFVEPNGATSAFLPKSGETPPVFAADDVRVKIASGAFSPYAHGPLGDVQLLTLKNGLQVVLVRRLGAPTVSATVGVRGGSATAEPLGVLPLALAVARPQRVGNGPPSQFGGSLSYSAGADASYVEGRAASGNLGDLLAILSDTVQSLRVSDDLHWSWGDLVKNMEHSETSPNAEAQRKFLAEVYPGSSLGRTPLAPNVEKLGPSDLQRWIDQAFRPQNATLAIVGDIDVQEVQKQVREYFDGWRGAQEPRSEARSGKLVGRFGPVRIIAIERPGAQTTEIRLGCSVEPQNQTDLVAMRMLGARLRAKLGTLARSTLGGSDGFSGGSEVQRQATRLDVGGSVDGRALVPVLAAARQELATLEDFKATADEVALMSWRQGVSWNGSDTTNAELAKHLVWLRLADFPMELLLHGYPELVATVTSEDLKRMAAECRKTAVLLVSGDPAVVDKALLATESSQLLRHGS